MSFEGLEPCPSGHKAEFSLVPDAIRCSEKSCAWHMVRVPISDWNTRATTPGTEMVPEGTHKALGEWLNDVEEWEADDSRGPGDSFDLLMQVVQLVRDDFKIAASKRNKET